MPHSIVSDICEGVSSCAKACPVGCIKPGIGRNKKDRNFFYIDFSICIDCGVCLQVCPVQGAVIDEERPDLQNV